MTITADQLTPSRSDVAALVVGRGFTDEQIDKHSLSAALYAERQLRPFLVGFPSPPLSALTWVACCAAARLERRERQDDERAHAHLETARRVQRNLGRELDRAATIQSSDDRRVWRPA